ncbi:unnamed protein product [Sphagnum jensenii]|uniref:Uncharacterized protein n=1 Tax=Sphagnum jensenii TaxID=128206 RepID=A0ABP1AE76_9BRYO
MAARGKLPSYMILLVCAFAAIALVGFQTLKECRTVAALFLAKANEIERLNNQHEHTNLLLLKGNGSALDGIVPLFSSQDVLFCQFMIVFHHLQELDKCVNSSQKDAADLKKMSSILKENDKIHRKLESKLEEAEASLEHSRKQLGVCQQGRQKCVDRESQLDAKEDEMLSLQQKLQEKDSELSAMKMQLAAAQQQDMNNKEDTAAAMKNKSELEQTEKATDNPDEERRSDDDLIKETTDGKHEEGESMMTAEAAHEKDGADKGTEDSSSEAVTVSETLEEHKSESLKKLEDPSVDNEETVDDRREIQEEDNNSQQEASD